MDKDDWENFAVSGKVMDYLEYKGCIDRLTNLSDVVTRSETAGNLPFAEENEKEEGVCDSHE